ncbi:adaptor protein MecA [Heyndrickxia sporothermodurans]
MKLERLAGNKIKYSITFEELSAKGFLQEEFESFIWYDLFDEMVEIAKKEYHCDIPDTISIEIFSLNSKEIVLILTMGEVKQEGNHVNQFIDSKIKKTIFIFESIEDIILLAFCLNNLQINANCKLVVFEDNYYLITANEHPLIILFKEYGKEANLSISLIEEYGHIIIENNALEQLITYFKN